MEAKQRFSHLTADATAVLARARKASELTIPGLIPPDGHTEAADLPTPYQSLGARGVNNLASKLLLTLFPPDSPNFRFLIDDKVVAALGTKRSKIEEALSARERAVTRKFEAAALRPTMFEVLKHLIVGGNVTLFLPASAGVRMFRLDQYRCVRNPDGTMSELVIRESVSPQSLTEAQRLAGKIRTGAVKPVDLYTHVKWADGRVVWDQELNGVILAESHSDVPADTSPWLVLRWNAVPGEHYGRGLCVEYLGDLISLEELAKAIVQIAAAAARTIILVNPNGVTDADDIKNAESGDAIVGREEDVSAFGLDKMADFQVTKATADDITLRLSHAFLLRSGTVRDAERVTAEEIREMAQELEDVLGGTYTVLGVELQLPLVKRFIHQMTAKNELPQLPKGSVEPIIVTGFQALGRNHKANRLRGAITDARNLLGDTVLEHLNAEEILTRLFESHGVEDAVDLVRTAEEVAASQQAAAQGDAVNKAIPGVTTAATKAALQ